MVVRVASAQACWWSPSLSEVALPGVTFLEDPGGLRRFTLHADVNTGPHSDRGEQGREHLQVLLAQVAERADARQHIVGHVAGQDAAQLVGHIAKDLRIHEGVPLRCPDLVVEPGTAAIHTYSLFLAAAESEAAQRGAEAAQGPSPPDLALDAGRQLHALHPPGHNP